MRKFSSIPEPTTDPRSLQNSVMALKEVVEGLTGQRPNTSPPVSWDDLVQLGVVSQQGALSEKLLSTGNAEAPHVFGTTGNNLTYSRIATLDINAAPGGSKESCGFILSSIGNFGTAGRYTAICNFSARTTATVNVDATFMGNGSNYCDFLIVNAGGQLRELWLVIPNYTDGLTLTKTHTGSGCKWNLDPLTTTAPGGTSTGVTRKLVTTTTI